MKYVQLVLFETLPTKQPKTRSIQFDLKNTLRKAELLVYNS